MTNGINEIIEVIEYENTILGLVPDFKIIPEVNNPEKINVEKMIIDIEDIYLERMAYLINTDNLFEELLM